MADKLFYRLGHHYILVMMILTRLFGSVGGLLVVYYVEFTLTMPSEVRTLFRVAAIIVVVIACGLTVMLALWETRSLRFVLKQIFSGEPFPSQLGSQAGTEAVLFVSRHHWYEAWLVPSSTLIPVLLVLKLMADASPAILFNITLAVFMSISMALMATFFAVNHCMQPVIRCLINRGVEIDYEALPVGKMSFRFGICFTLIIATTALMIGTLARQRASDIVQNPQNQSIAVENLIQHSTYITVAAVIAGMIYSTVLTNSVASRIAVLVKAMDSAGCGDLSQRICPTGNDEVDVLARRFNIMVEQLDNDHRTIRELNANLESRVSSRTAELESTVEQLRDTQRRLTEYNEQLEVARAGAEAANKAKSDFLANISHELRTPLNCVIGMMELMLDMSLDTQQRKYAQAARSSGSMLLQLLNDVLDFSKIEAGMLELEHIEFELSEAIEPVIELAAYRCHDKSLDMGCFIDPRIPTTVVGDPGRLRQVLTNLINNAVKFTDKGNIVVRASLQEQIGDTAHVLISVQDTGIGIPNNRFDRLFHSFSQVDASTTRKFGGTGLGLAICKQLCELMGGQIGVDSEVNRGSIFYITVPLHVARRQEPSKMTTPSEFAALRTLVIDDVEVTRQTLCQQLDSWGFESHSASNVAEALTTLDEAAAREEPVQLVLIDHDLPDVQREIMSRWEDVDKATRPAFVLLLPMGATCDTDDFRSRGYTDCLSTPVVQPAMCETLRRVLMPETAAADQGQTRQASLPRTKRTGSRILVAEDNEFNQEVAVELLTRIGFQCDVVKDGRYAVEAVKRKMYDAVLMDCQMPEMDGIEATRTIRTEEQREGRNHIPIVALTANAIHGERERCLDAGMDAYLSKPLNPLKLIETIEACLNEIDTSDEVEQQAMYTVEAERLEHTTLRDSPPPASVESDVLDYSELLNRCMGDKELLRTLVSKFLGRVQSDVMDIEHSISAGELAQTVILCHSLKGAAANLSAGSLREASNKLEHAARASDLDLCRTLTPELQLQCGRFVATARLVLAQTGEIRPFEMRRI